MSDEIDQQILTELKKLRRASQFSIYACVLLLAPAVLYFAVLRPKMLRSRSVSDALTERTLQVASKPAPESGDPWTQIQAALDRGDYPSALSLARSFVARQPTYHYSHASLGMVYVAMNDFTNAEAEYVHAVELYPAEEHEKALGAIRKRLAREQAASIQAR